MANSHKANRLSSLLSLGHSRNDSASSQSQSSSASHPPDNSQDHAPGSPEPTLQSPSKHRLHKHYPSAGSSLPPLSTMTTLPALAPPPAIGADGLQRPPSAPGQLSTYSSGQASRDGSRSRPTTPNMLAPYDSLSSPRPQTPTSAKVSKRRSWLPGKADKSPVGPERFEPQAWIAGLKEHIPYNFAPLINGEKVNLLSFSKMYPAANADLGSGALERKCRYLRSSLPGSSWKRSILQSRLHTICGLSQPDTAIAKIGPQRTSSRTGSKREYTRYGPVFRSPDR